MGIDGCLLWQPAIVVIVTDDDCRRRLVGK